MKRATFSAGLSSSINSLCSLYNTSIFWNNNKQSRVLKQKITYGTCSSLMMSPCFTNSTGLSGSNVDKQKTLLILKSGHVHLMNVEFTYRARWARYIDKTSCTSWTVEDPLSGRGAASIHIFAFKYRKNNLFQKEINEVERQYINIAPFSSDNVSFRQPSPM